RADARAAKHPPEGSQAQRPRRIARETSRTIGREWAALTGDLGTGGSLLGPLLNLARQTEERDPFHVYNIASTVGTFYDPNSFEKTAVRYLVEDLEHARGQKRPLLVLSGQLPALRRCLRTLCRLAPLPAPAVIV